MSDPAPKAHWAGVSEFEYMRLLRRGRSRGRLTLDEVVEVLQDAELTTELIGEIRGALDAQGIELDETVVDLDDDADEEDILRLLRPRLLRPLLVSACSQSSLRSPGHESRRRRLQPRDACRRD